MDDLTPTKAGNSTETSVEYGTEFNFNFETGMFDSFVDTFSNALPNLKCVLGKIASFDSTKGTLSVYVGGSSTAISPIKMLNNFEPVVGKAVWLLKIDTDYLAIGQQRVDASSFLDSWQTWTPTLTNFTEGTSPTKYYKWVQIGKTVICKFNLLAGTGASATGSTNIFAVSLPVTSSSQNYRLAQTGVVLYNGATYFSGVAMQDTDTTIRLYAQNTGSTYASLSGVTSTIPSASWWASGSRLIFTYVYETP